MKTISEQVEEFEELGIINFDDTEPLLDIVPKVQDADGKWHDFKKWYTQALQERDRIAREEEREACAVTVWNEWAKYPNKMEDNETNRAYSSACKVIRERKNLTTPLQTNTPTGGKN